MAKQASATSITVSWTPPPDATGVTGYRISYARRGGNKQFKDVSDASTNNDTIPNLTTGSTYSISIAATSDGLLSEVVGPIAVELGMTCAYITG